VKAREPSQSVRSGSLEAENKRLMKEIAELRMEKEISMKKIHLSNYF
jgi:hypothetical protein